MWKIYRSSIFGATKYIQTAQGIVFWLKWYHIGRTTYIYYNITYHEGNCASPKSSSQISMSTISKNQSNYFNYVNWKNDWKDSKFISYFPLWIILVSSIYTSCWHASMTVVMNVYWQLRKSMYSYMVSINRYNWAKSARTKYIHNYVAHYSWLTYHQEAAALTHFKYHITTL